MAERIARFLNGVAEAIQGVGVENVARLQTRHRRHRSINVFHVVDRALILDHVLLQAQTLPELLPLPPSESHKWIPLCSLCPLWLELLVYPCRSTIPHHAAQPIITGSGTFHFSRIARLATRDQDGGHIVNRSPCQHHHRAGDRSRRRRGYSSHERIQLWILRPSLVGWRQYQHHEIHRQEHSQRSRRRS